ncbi:hypothetical protein KBY97_08275 [Synechococcus sp. ATX 2A4]|uniref:PulJ/GspJ family protein n=1 Tax=Synechococcus sp. ATX 2A4 TaxID=2823727 RepID=UPI0020CEC9EF|nr:hypothetical protein [Synechococcus sp. ATX 2A4]MCP9885120.1 hypothetical protein [Synechococcus sp. ATX 2A4]
MTLRLTPTPTTPTTAANRRPLARGGFGLVEMLLAMTLGLGFCGVVIQALVGEGRHAQQFTRLLRERGNQRRALALIRSDLMRTSAVAADPGSGASRCGLAGRTAVLRLLTPEGTIDYSVGAAPSGIWQGRVLVRCGPAYGLDGQVNPGSAFQSRVVLDRLATKATPWQGCEALLGRTVGPAEAARDRDLAGSSRLPFSACLDPESELVGLRLEQSFPGGPGGSDYRISTEAAAGPG